MIYIQQVVFPDYRRTLFGMMRTQYPDFRVICGDENFTAALNLVTDRPDITVPVRNVFFVKKQILIQPGAFGRLIDAEVLVLSFNLRILSNLAVIWIRKLLGRPTLVWGHTTGSNQIARSLSRLYLSACAGFIAYTESQAADMRKKRPGLRVWTASNACLSEVDTTPVENDGHVHNVLYVGRLIKAKKLDVLMGGFSEARRHGGLLSDSKLIIVGDGPERAHLETMVKQLGLEGRVEFTGHVNDIGELRRIYKTALVATSPGYAGLSVTQALAFGVPMLVGDNEPHSPEIEACVEGWNSVYFRSDDSSDCARKLADFFSQAEDWLQRRVAISDWTRERYTYERMKAAFDDAFEHSKHLSASKP